MNRGELIRRVSRKTSVPQPKVEEMLEQILQTISEALSCGEAVMVTNFGKFETRERGPTVRRLPGSGIDVKVPRKIGVLFRASPTLKQNVQREDTAYE